MRVVLLGKGGSGKSSLAGLLCTTLAQQGEQVVAIDADTVPGLAQVLGMAPTEEWSLAGMAARRNGGWQLEGTAADIVARCTREGPNGVRFLQIGNADAGFRDFELNREQNVDRWSGMVAFNTISRSYDDQGGWVVVDLQGGTLQVAGGLVGTTGVALAVVEPFAKSVLTVRRFVEMGDWPEGLRLVAVANKVASPDDTAYLEAEMAGLGLPLWAMIPDDPAVQRAERAGTPLAAMDPGSTAQRAVESLVDRLRTEAGPAAPVAASAAPRT